jgi:hypothetical protein
VAGEKVREPRHYVVVRIDGAMMIVLAIVYDGMLKVQLAGLKRAKEVRLTSKGYRYLQNWCHIWPDITVAYVSDL